MTRDRRSTYRLCGAKRRNGEPCRLFAGQATDHLGSGRCYLHGGRTPNGRKAAAKEEARRRMAQLGQAVDIEPTEALLGSLRLAAGHLAYLRDELAIGDQTTYDEAVLLNMFGAELDRVARIARSCIDAGIQERQVKLAEDYGRTVANILRRVFDDPDLGMTSEQRAALPALLRVHLSSVERRPALATG